MHSKYAYLSASAGGVWNLILWRRQCLHTGRRSCKTLWAERRSCVVLGPSLGSRHMKPTWPAVRHACREVADGLTKQRTAHLPAYVIYHTVSSLNRCNGRKTRLSVGSTLAAATSNAVLPRVKRDRCGSERSDLVLCLVCRMSLPCFHASPVDPACFI